MRNIVVLSSMRVMSLWSTIAMLEQAKPVTRISSSIAAGGFSLGLIPQEDKKQTKNNVM